MSIECAFFGSLVRDAEVKTSKAGKTYLRANLRVENGDKAEFINTMVFDPEAIAVGAKMVKGARVYIEGRLSLEIWTGKDGVAKQSLSVMAFHCRLSQIGRNKPKRETLKPSQNFPRDMHAPIGNGADDLNDDIDF
jgi:single-stranded DNA-binding protein